MASSGEENRVGTGDGEFRRRRTRLFLIIATIIFFPVLVLLAFYASLNVTATSGPLFPGLGAPSGIYFTMTVNTTQYTQFLVNVSSVQNQSFPNVFPSISIPPSVLITIIIVVLIVVSLSVVLNTRRQTAASAEFENEAELEKQRGEVADILDRTASELRQGGEYRRSVLECYRRICEILESKSKIDARPLTAREFESSVSFRLKLDTPYLSQITDIFEIARYSPHEISKADADAAINCLTNLSSVLREIKNSSDEGRK